MMVGRRPESMIHKVGNSDISNPNRHMIDVVSVQLTEGYLRLIDNIFKRVAEVIRVKGRHTKYYNYRDCVGQT